MFNISMTTKIKNLEKAGCTKAHIAQCIYDRNLHEKPNFSYFGKTVAKGTMLLHTKNGDFTLKFDEKNGWARSAEIL